MVGRDRRYCECGHHVSRHQLEVCMSKTNKGSVVAEHHGACKDCIELGMSSLEACQGFSLSFDEYADYVERVSGQEELDIEASADRRRRRNRR